MDKSLKNIEKKIGVALNDEVIRETATKAIAKLLAAGIPEDAVRKMLNNARPIADFAWFEERLSYDDFQAFFSSPVRRHGIDGSIDVAYGASTAPAILGKSPYTSPMDVYLDLRGVPQAKHEDLQKEVIFYAGHKIEPVLRDYFRFMYGSRYMVFDCDIQWASKKYPHFIGNVDGLLYDTVEDKLGILEIKHTTPNNVKTQMEVKNDTPPAYWEIQTRCYMELLDADFTCLFLGWGPRPTLDFTAMTKIERDKELGESILESCEDFIEYNVIRGNKPSLADVEEPELIRKYFAEQYDVRKLKNKEAHFTPKNEALKAVLKAKEELEKKKDEKSKLDAEIKKLEKDYLNKQAPFIEEIKDCEYGYVEDEDGNLYCISYKPTRTTVSVEELKMLYPRAFHDVAKDAIDTTKLKTKYPEIYSKCKVPSDTRKFSIRKVKSKK